MQIMEPIYQALCGMRRPDMRELAEQSGVPLHTILKIKSGETDNPKIKTVQALHDVIASKRRK